MQTKKIHEDNGRKTYVLVFEEGEEVMAGLTEFADSEGLDAASLTAIGAFSATTLGYFDMERTEYERIPVNEQAEVLSLVGDIAPVESGGQQAHVHAVLGLSDGTTRGGHLIEARVRPTLEVVVTESPEHLRRRTDPRTGLALISTEDG